MAVECTGLDITLVSDEDLSNDRHRFVVIDGTSGRVRRPNAANELCIGILQNAPNAAGLAAVVRVDGVSKLQSAGAIAAGAKITAEYVSATDAGKGLATVTASDLIRAQCIFAAGAEDELCTVQLLYSKV
jgi:hypothetical protein